MVSSFLFAHMLPETTKIDGHSNTGHSLQYSTICTYLSTIFERNSVCAQVFEAITTGRYVSLMRKRGHGEMAKLFIVF